MSQDSHKILLAARAAEDYLRPCRAGESSAEYQRALEAVTDYFIGCIYSREVVPVPQAVVTVIKPCTSSGPATIVSALRGAAARLMEEAEYHYDQ